jgi:DNA polymerase-1
MSNRVLVIDGNFYIHRCWHTLRTNRPIEEALPYNFVSLVMRDACAVKATHILVAIDGSKVFRYDLFPAYKGNRSEGGGTSDGNEVGASDIYSYLPAIRAYLESSGLCWIQLKKYEADDILASAATQYGKMPATKVIFGNRDKDSFQSLTDNVVAYDSCQEQPRYITVEKVEKKMGIKVDQMVMYQTLIGDKIDNIPTLLTPVKAKKVINKFGSFGNWFAKAERDEKSWLRANQVALSLNKSLVCMKTDLPLPELPLMQVPKLDRKDWPKSWYAYQAFRYPRTKGLFK